MKTIGLIGGMSWESTAHYYQAINQGIKAQLGGLHSAQIVMVSLDFQPIADMQAKGDWEQAAAVLSNAAQALEQAGADAFLICTNTMHKVADSVQQQVNIPLLHIAEATGRHLVNNQVRHVALLGTQFTMTDGFYHRYLEDHFDVDVLVPNQEQRDTVHSVIYNELCAGKVLDSSRQDYLHIIDSLTEQGAQGVILGCTEIAMLVKPSDTHAALFDTTAIHAQAAVEFALSE